MRRLPRIIPDDTRITFMRWRVPWIAGSVLVIILSIVLVLVRGLNFGIDFKGGLLLDVRLPQAADLADMRSTLSALDLGAVQLQTFGAATDVLIRVEAPDEAGDRQQAIVAEMKNALDTEFGPGIEYRRAEFVGPKVSQELLRDGVLAAVIAIAGVLLYLWFRFEWQYGIGAVLTLVHDTAATVGFFALTGLEFDLSTVAAILTIIGYSLNDTVVVYDRIRENLRRFRRMPIDELIDKSINDTLARTVMTSMTTLLALLALVFFGGEVIRGFTIAMIFGVFIGCYSTVFIGSPVLIYFNLRSTAPKVEEKETASTQPAE
jgi:preprotein translocase SecF subunit